MKPEKALELVGRYARLTHDIKGCKERIAKGLEGCNGVAGFRHETEKVPFGDDLIDLPTDRATADHDNHLTGWYAAIVVEPTSQYDDGSVSYRDIGDAEKSECLACWSAHQIVKERKAWRRQLGAVKAAMTRSLKEAA